MRTIIVPVSGGKDSQVVLSLALKTGRTVVAVHQNTGYDHPDTYRQIDEMESFYGVKVDHTTNGYGGMFGFLEKAGYFPNAAARGCTQRLKQRPFLDWLLQHKFTSENAEIWFGMRSDESAARASKYGELTDDDEFTLADVSPFYGSNKTLRSSIGAIQVRLPIVSWTTDKVFAYLRNEGGPMNSLYARGHHRVGCYPCLLSRKSEWTAAAKDPTGREHLGRLIELEDRWKVEGNPRKFIKVHRVWDVRQFLDDGESLPELPLEECGYCSI